MEVPCDELDRVPFRAGTVITLGNGKKCSFWSDNWLQGCSPKDLAPGIFNLSRRKGNNVHLSLQNNHWLPILNPITTISEIDELVRLGSRLQEVMLLENTPDDIRWKWTPNGEYSAKSAYEAQFQGDSAKKKIGALLTTWWQGCSPKDLAPGIFNLSRRKGNNVHLSLQNNHWLPILNPITTISEIDELVRLGSRLQEVMLLENTPDDIRWKWTPNGEYSAKSAYEAQFQGPGRTKTSFFRLAHFASENPNGGKLAETSLAM
uniref:Putative non-LTR retroelement reverse transcriptase n=1 Tax=Oryza sativa subsp. indica TaxID=39946 RepID=Q0N4T5_ORYSI|nr:putative non-LTR retroelement reverse transcriptase [Oryza sativa Indica Group]